MKFFVFIFLMLLFTSAIPIKQKKIQIGVLEIVVSDGKSEFEESYTCIRPLFKKVGNKWVLNIKSNNKYWNVIYKNNVKCKLISLKDSTLIKLNYNHLENCHSIKNTKKIPKIGKKSLNYSGWADIPTYKPLVVNSSTYYKDSQNWKMYKPLKSEKDSITLWLKRKYKISSNVKLLENFSPTYSYSSSDSSEKLICIHIADNRKLPIIDERCYPDCGYQNSWFYIENNKIKFIHSMLDLIDIGDYDNDGKNEFLFMKQAYNNDGYILFYNDFKQSIMHDWSYH